MNLAPEVKKQIRIMAIGSAICAALVFAGFCIFDKFSLLLLAACVLGYLIAVVDFILLSFSVTAALETGDDTAGKRKLRFSRIIRTVVKLGLLVLVIVLLEKSDYNVLLCIPVVLGLFYVRIVIAARSIVQYFKLKNAPRIPDDDAAEEKVPAPIEDDEDEEEDEFEKFVGHFAKGPIPGQDKKDKTDTTDTEEENK